MANRRRRASTCAAAAFAAITVAVAGGCDEIVPAPVPVEVRFDPAIGVLPFPHDLLFTGSIDGTLNIPVEEDAPANDPRLALNEVDGFSRSAPIHIPLSAPVDAVTVRAGESVRVFSVTTTGPGGSVTGVERELAGNREFSAVTKGNAIVVVPLVPLPGDACLVVVTRAVADAAGVAVTPSRIYKLARSPTSLLDDAGNSARPELIDDDTARALEPLRALVSSTEGAVAGFGLSSSDVALSFTFTLGSARETLAALRERAESAQITLELADAYAIAGTPALTTASSGGAGIANVHVAALRLPSFVAPDDPLGAHFQAKGGGAVTRFAPPEPVTDIIVPALITVPNAGSGHALDEEGERWPVVVFQHGIVGDRTFLLAIADTLAQAGFVGVAIDLPLHGVTGLAGSPSAAVAPLLGADGSAYTNNAFNDFQPSERAPDIDVIDNDTREPVPDGLRDGSGAHFINLSSLLTSRDSVRQAAADLMRVRRIIPFIDINKDGEPDLDGDNVTFVGHSLGAIVGTVMLGVDGDAWRSAVLANPGSGLGLMLLGSDSFGPLIEGSLSQSGLTRGTPEFDSFFVAVHTVLDAADPIVLAPSVTTAVLAFQVDDDVVVPNRVANAPLSGTEPLLTGLDTIAVDNETPRLAGDALRGAVRFGRGGHNSLIDPGPDRDVTIEMQGLMARFAASAGTSIIVGDSELLADAQEDGR